MVVVLSTMYHNTRMPGIVQYSVTSYSHYTVIVVFSHTISSVDQYSRAVAVQTAETKEQSAKIN